MLTKCVFQEPGQADPQGGRLRLGLPVELVVNSKSRLHDRNLSLGMVCVKEGNLLPGPGNPFRPSALATRYRAMPRGRQIIAIYA